MYTYNFVDNFYILMFSVTKLDRWKIKKNA